MTVGGRPWYQGGGWEGRRALSTDTVDFKFTFVKNGAATSLFGKKGSATAEALVLDGEPLAYDAVADTTTRDRRLVLVLRAGTTLPEKLANQCADKDVLVLEVYKVGARDLEKTIDKISSAKAAAAHKEALAAEGRDDAFRAASCPGCGATIDLSGLSRTPYVYCRYCESVFKEGMGITTDGASYRVCDECNLFGHVKGYTEFYFYFLLVVYGWSMRRRHVCSRCARSIMGKALLMNLIFILGVPTALWGLIKSFTGKDPHLADLDGANALALAGRFAQADAMYGRLHGHYTDHPGLLLNQGLAHLIGKDPDGALAAFERALKACSNYYPVVQVLQQIRQGATHGA